MALAFIILAHKNARQVSRLFHAIRRPEDVIVLHFDRRAEPALHDLGRELAQTYPNVVLLHSRCILWGGYQMAAVQIEAMAAALRISDRWHHFINLTGQDFPLKPVGELDSFLSAHPEANYVSWFDPLTTRFWQNAEHRVTRYYLEWPWLERILCVRGVGRPLRWALHWKNQLPHLPVVNRKHPEFHYYGGANHVILSRAGAKYVTADPKAQRIAHWLRHAAHANEMIFQMVMLNSELASTVVNSHLREIDFPPGSPHPRTFRSSDFDRLVQSSRFFARKFDEAVDAEILDRLAEHLERSIPTEGSAPAHS